VGDNFDPEGVGLMSNSLFCAFVEGHQELSFPGLARGNGKVKDWKKY
jgi:hypothetical protein